MIYKVMAKLIAQRIKPILSEVISEEKIRFLYNRQILDVVSLDRESIHSIKKGKQNSYALKLDLSKSYDKLS